MTIAAIALNPEPLALAPDDSLADALALMLEHDVNHLAVIEAAGFVGLVSINDILRELIPAGARVKSGLTDLAFAGDAIWLLTAHLRELPDIPVSASIDRKLPILRSDCPLLEAALLLNLAATPLPVVGDDGRFLGLLSRRALLKYLVAHGDR